MLKYAYTQELEGNFGNPEIVTELSFNVYYLSKSTVRVVIGDNQSARWEVPVALNNTRSIEIDNTDYDVDVGKDPFSFYIRRKLDN